MPRNVPIGPKEADQALRLVAEGKTLNEIATVIGLSYGGLHKALTETWPDEYAEAKERRNDAIRNRVWSMGMIEGGAQEVDATTTRWAMDHLIKWHLPEARESQRLEITGDNGGPIAIAHEQRLTLAHLYAFAAAIPGYGGSDSGEFPDARPVLPAPENGGAAAGALPPGSES